MDHFHCPWVYPRVCGGTFLYRRGLTTETGLSPRVRGNHIVDVDGEAHYGSIPACAGEPAPCRHLPAAGAVYPRVCGGTLRRELWEATRGGLSPRVRGNPAPVLPGGCSPRSIPACAGEPALFAADGSVQGVYPRVCGGTPISDVIRECIQGLSPRVRGNLVSRASAVRSARSIPACAGEPLCWPMSLCHIRVYPRVCGGTKSTLAGSLDDIGLSPRVRGNRRLGHDGSYRMRSIPACAGEP